MTHAIPPSRARAGTSTRGGGLVTQNRAALGGRAMTRKKETPPIKTIKRQLYKNTQIESSFGFNTLAIVNGKPETCNLKDFLSSFLDFREDVVIKKTKFDLKKSEERAHILIGLSVSVENLEKIRTL